MKKIEAIIRPQRLIELKDTLSTNTRVYGFTVLEVRGFGRQRGYKEIFRGNEYDVDLLPKLMIVLVTEDSFVDKIIDKITSVCYTGQIGDGKIFVSPVEEVIRIRTEDRGKNAL